MRKRFELLVLAGLLAVVLPGELRANSICEANSQNLITNCGFETGDFTDWTLSGDTAFSFVGSFDPNSGAYSAFLGAGNSDDDTFATGPSISQTIATSSGQSYSLSYFLSDISSDPNGFEALWDGIVIPGSVVVDAGDFDYTEYQFAVTGTGSDTLTFASYQDELSNWALDDIQVAATATPEPSPFVLIGVAFAAFGSLRFRLLRNL